MWRLSPREVQPWPEAALRHRRDTKPSFRSRERVSIWYRVPRVRLCLTQNFQTPADGRAAAGKYGKKRLEEERIRETEAHAHVCECLNT